MDCLDVCRLSPKIGSSVLCFLSATTMNSILMWDFSQGSQLGDKRRRKDEVYTYLGNYMIFAAVY